MHNILRTYVTATSLLVDADSEQIDERGRLKAVSSVWAEMPRMSADVIHVAEELIREPDTANGEPCNNEERWLKAVIDEVATTTDQPQHSTEESWAKLARSIAWLSFCLKQASSYAEDSEYGEQGFDAVCRLLAEADDLERALLTTAITEASTHIESTGSVTCRDIVQVYDELVRSLQA